MHETPIIVAGLVAIAAGFLAVTSLSLRLRWPQRVRWLVATNALGSWAAPADSIVMREVFVVDVWSREGRLNIDVRAGGTASHDTTLVAEKAARSTVAQIARWRAAATPLLYVSNGARDVSLHGPTRVVSELIVQDPDEPGTRSSSTEVTPPLSSHGHGP